jgi:hypothetical protein
MLHKLAARAQSIGRCDMGGNMEPFHAWPKDLQKPRSLITRKTNEMDHLYRGRVVGVHGTFPPFHPCTKIGRK